MEDPHPVEVPIAVFVGSWLPYSETFIYDQLRFQQRTRAHVFARSFNATAARFPYAPIATLPPVFRLSQLAGFAPPIDRRLKESGARLALAHFGLNGAYALPFVRRRALPLMVMFHGHDVGGLLPQNRWTLRYGLYQHRRDELFTYASRLCCASSELAEQLLQCGAPEHKVHVHHLGIDLERFQPRLEDTEGPLTILMIGRLVEKKGMSYGLRAFARVFADHSTAQLHIVGDGPLRSELEGQADALGVVANVHFRGALAHDEVRDALRRAHIVMTPSVVTESGDRESGVIVLKEAAATAIPAIGTLHGGIPEIIEHETTGLLVEERNIEQLADALDRLLRDRALRQRMGLAAREKMCREYDQRRQVAALESLMLDML